MKDWTRPKLMGVLNITPDSFSDGGQYLAPEAAIKQARLLVEQGAEIVDVGGESTRPGAMRSRIEFYRSCRQSPRSSMS
jgi:dihydropteroate synthase